MDYKSTLNLPETKFPMKADLPKREPEFLKDWTTCNLYQLIRRKSQKKKKFILHDGPPYANGDIHIGHALNKTLKDIIVKFKTMCGYDSAYIPGWDCHGLPVEHQLFRELGINKSQISQIDFRKKASAYAQKYVSVQKDQFMRLGVFGDWQNPYLTLTPDYEASIVKAFGELVEKGYVYHGLKPVNWCFVCETALAEAEVEYADHLSPSIYVKFKLDKMKGYQENSYLVIWTTTPWTLIANVAVAVHPDFIYSYIKTEEGNLILAKDLLSAVLSPINIGQYELIREIKGRDLAGLTYHRLFTSGKGRIVLADYVSSQEGTGLVHTAPGHGNEDYLTGLKYKLDVLMPVDSKGRFDSSVPAFKGLNVYDANKGIIEHLKRQGRLLFNTDIQHAYPHCWRCKNPLIFRATKQWFLNLQHKHLRKKLLKIIKQVHWIPESGEERISKMVELRPDWCLSRQRYWGVPIPVIICHHCAEEILLPAVIDRFAHFVSREGTDCWFQRDISDFLQAGFRCPHCKKDKFSKGVDILDVWFDSGVSHQAVLKKRKELEFPCAMYLEGSDQHRGWFQSSLIPAVCIDNTAPFKRVLTHGFVVDGMGRKMSKSLGNVISPEEIIKDYGADILRLWVASSDYNEDIRISREILDRLAEAYRKMRNTLRFILSNLYDFNPDQDQVGPDELRKIDRWIMNKTHDLLQGVRTAYEIFQFHRAYKLLYDFCNEDLSMYYLDMVKGRLYTYAANALERRAAQTVIYEILNVLVRMIAPILVFTAEEVWGNMPKEKKNSRLGSVHLLDWPIDKDIANFCFTQRDLDNFSEVINLIPQTAKHLEEKRNLGVIGSSFDARINVLTKDEFRYKYLRRLKEDLTELFRVSQVDVLKEDKYLDTAIEVLKAGGLKCQRCWNYSPSVGENKEHPALCLRCLRIVGQMKPGLTEQRT